MAQSRKVFPGHGGDSNKALCLWESFNALRLQKQLCDVTLHSSDGDTFPAHKAILAASSPYFRALFTNGMKETGEKEIPMHGVNSRILRIMLDYVYTHSAPITMENVMLVLPAADNFLVAGLVEQCTKFLESSLSVTNCVGVMKFAQMYNQFDLVERSKAFLLRNFSTFSDQSDELLQMDMEELVELFSSDNLNVRSEQDVFEAALRWIDFWPEDRSQHMAIFLQNMRLGLINTDYFTQNISSHPYILKHHVECEPIVRQAWDFLYGIESSGSRPVDLNNPLVRPRVPHDVIFAVGGWSGGSPIMKVETYDTRADRWYAHETLDDAMPRAYHGMVAIAGMIYVIGGFDGSSYYNSVRRFDPSKKTWSDAAPMYTQRCYLSAIAMEDYIYVCGGYDGRCRLTSCERFDPKNNQWTKLASMGTRRSDAGSDELNGKIYIFGGFSGEQCLDTAEVYCPVVNQWTIIRSMSCRRSGVSCVALQGQIYAMGGFDGERRLCSVERYDPETNKWSPTQDMYVPRSNFAASVVEGMLFAMGGFNGNYTIRHVECYDPETNEWYDATDMKTNRSALKTCVVSGLPNVRDFTFHGQTGDN